MRTVENTVYSYDELSSEAKHKVREYFRDMLINDAYTWMSESLEDYLAELLAKNKIKTVEFVGLYYSLSYSQGDGVMFVGTFQKGAWEYEVKHYGSYYHENSKTIDSITSIKTGEEPRTSEAWRKAFEQFEPVYTKICVELKRYGYEMIEAAGSDEAVDEYIGDNSADYEFNGDGSIYYGV